MRIWVFRILIVISVGLLDSTAIKAEDATEPITETPPAVDSAPAAAVPRSDTPPTDINSDTMDFDMQQRQATFLGHVVVLDHALKLQADKLVVQFDEKNQIQTIEASGNVVISADQNKALSGKAVYDFAVGTIVLSEQPELLLGANKIVGAEKIVYNRKAGKFSNEGGQPHIIINDPGTGIRPLDALIPEEKAMK